MAIAVVSCWLLLLVVIVVVVVVIVSQDSHGNRDRDPCSFALGEQPGLLVAIIT